MKSTHTIPPWEDQCEWHIMTRMTGPNCAVMCNLINTHTCVVRCNLINTHTHNTRMHIINSISSTGKHYILEAGEFLTSRGPYNPSREELRNSSREYANVYSSGTQPRRKLFTVYLVLYSILYYTIVVV